MRIWVLRIRKDGEGLGRCVKCMSVRSIAGWDGGERAGNEEENESHATTANSVSF